MPFLFQQSLELIYGAQGYEAAIVLFYFDNESCNFFESLMIC